MGRNHGTNDSPVLYVGEWMKINIMFLCVVLFVTIVYPQSDSSSLVWPSPPDHPRIMHVQTISSPESLQPKKGIVSKILGFLMGSEKNAPWLVQPVGIGVSPDGRIVVADPGANCIHIINAKEREFDFVAETKFGKFISPVSVAFAPDGRLYVSDSQRGDIIVFDDDLEADFRIKGNLNRPTGIIVSDGKLFVSDTGEHKVVVFDLEGNYVHSFGHRGAGFGEFNYPIQLVAGDSLLVLDGLNYRVQQFDFAGRYMSTFGKQGNVAGRFASPKGIALDSDGNVYVTDALMDNFQIFNPSGQLLLVVGRRGVLDGEFMSPGGICIDKGDNIYIVETLNKRIQIFQFLR